MSMILFQLSKFTKEQIERQEIRHDGIIQTQVYAFVQKRQIQSNEHAICISMNTLVFCMLLHHYNKSKKGRFCDLVGLPYIDIFMSLPNLNSQQMKRLHTEKHNETNAVDFISLTQILFHLFYLILQPSFVSTR